MKKNSTSAIGIFDSGLGGLSILKEISNRLPNEELIYLADSDNAPYGEKPKEHIIEISRKNTEFLISKNCKLIVVACNTATTNAISILRNNYNIPFIGIEPAIKPAALNSKNACIGVLATKGTLSSDLFAETTKKFTSHTKVIEVEGKGIVEAIESNASNTIGFEQLLKNQLKPFVEAKIDTLVLGCSHYPFIVPQIRKCLVNEVIIIDSGFAVARQTDRILQNLQLKVITKKSQKPSLNVYTNKTSKDALLNILENLKIDQYKQFDL